MSWTFRLARIWGVEVFIHWTLPIWILLDVMRSAGGHFSPQYTAVMIAVEVSLFGLVLLHELGHCWAARKNGIRADTVILWPLGGLAMVGSGMESPKAELKIALAGPAVNLVLGGLGYGLSQIAGDGLLQLAMGIFVSLNMRLLLFNLIPCFPMDGGRALRAFLSLWMGQVRASLITARLAMVIAVLFGLWGLKSGNFVLVMIAVFIFMQAQNEARIYSSLPQDGVGVYWRGQRIEVHPTTSTPRPSRPGWVQTWRARSAQKRWLKERESQQDLKLSVDQILDKMNRVGFDGLTPAEQKILREASKAKGNPDLEI